MKNKIIIIFAIIIILVTILVMILALNNVISINKKIKAENQLFFEEGLTLSSSKDNKVLVTICKENGIDKIEYPNGFSINCNGRNVVAINYEVEIPQEYIFKTTDINGNVTYDSFWAPNVNIQITKKDIALNLENLKQTVQEQLLSKNIATNFVDFGLGEQNSINSATQDVATIFNKWKSFGDGKWGYNASNKWIYNTYNSTKLTGFYDPESNYETIELSFEARTTDSDDDMIGSAIRFTQNATEVYTSYLFLLDRHDSSGKGINNGEFNGITKLNNKSFSYANMEKLSVNPSLRWTRSKWQSYKFTAKGSKIEAYLDGQLVASAIDDSITTGSFGFVSYSQAYSYFRNIVVTTTKSYTLAELLANKIWDAERENVVVNINNSIEELLKQEEGIWLFNENNIHYIGVGNEVNKEEIEQFITNIGDKGTFTESSDMDNAIVEIVEYIEKIVK